MKKLMSVKELIEAGYPKDWLYQLAHSEDFVEAGGRRLPAKKSKIYFDPVRLDRYLEQQTLLNQ